MVHVFYFLNVMRLDQQKHLMDYNGLFPLLSAKSKQSYSGHVIVVKFKYSSLIAWIAL